MDYYTPVNRGDTARVFRWLFEEAVECFESGIPQKEEKAIGLFEQLLENRDLPMLIRARCHANLAICEGDYLYHARQTVRCYEYIAEMEPNKEEKMARMIEAAKGILADAEKTWAEEHAKVDAPEQKAESS